jgi:hypothetical protein
MCFGESGSAESTLEPFRIQVPRISRRHAALLRQTNLVYQQDMILHDGPLKFSSYVVTGYH